MPDLPNDKRRSRRRKILLGLLAFASLFTLLAAVGAAIFLQGERLGNLVTNTLGNAGLPGRVQVGGITWKPRLLWDFVTNRPTPIVIHNLKIDDPDGTRVLDLSRLELKIPVRSAIGGKVRLIDVVIGPKSFWRFAVMKDGKGNGFLSALIPPSKPRQAPPVTEKTAAKDGFLLELVNIDIKGLTAEFDYPGAWGLKLNEVTGAASVIIDGDFVGWDATKLHATKGGFLRVLDDIVLPFDDVRVRRVATTRQWPNDIFLEVEAGRTGQSVLTGKGFFTHIYDEGPPGIDLHTEFSRAGDALAAVAAGQKINGLTVKGPDARLSLDLSKPFSEIAIAGQLSGLTVGYAGGFAEDLKLRLNFSAAEPLSVSVRDMSFGIPEGGAVSMAADLKGTQASAQVQFKNVVNDAFVPPGLREMVAGRINGKVNLGFDLQATAGHVQLQRFSLLRNKAGGLPRSLMLDGKVAGSAERIDVSNLRATVPGANARVQGRIDLAKKLIGLSVQVAARDLPRALAFMQPPKQIPKSAQVQVQVGGQFMNPNVQGTATAEGLGVGIGGDVAGLKARFSLRNGLAKLDALEGQLFGGTMEASGDARLYRGTLDRMLKVPLINLQIAGEKIDLGQILQSPELAGRISFNGWARGPTDKLEGELTLPPDTQLQLLGELWRIRGFAVEVDPKQITLRSTELKRERGGSVRLEGKLSLERGQAMHWSIQIRDAPLRDLPGVPPGALPTMAGSIDADLEVTGSREVPALAGQMKVSQVVLEGRNWGDILLQFAPRDAGGTHVTGRVFNRLDVVAEVALPNAGPSVDAELSFSNLTLQDLQPELAERLGFNGRTTGSIKLTLKPNAPLDVEVRLADLDLVSRPRNDLLGGGPPLRVKNEGPVVARLRGNLIVLEPTRLQTTGGLLELGGALRGDQLENVVVRGQLDLALLAPALSPFVQRSEGNVTLALRAWGPMMRPRMDGRLTVTRGIEVLFPTLDLPVKVPEGRIVITPTDVALQKLVVQVGESRLTLQGRASFTPDYSITRFGIGLDGSVNAKMLPLLAPRHVMEAEGTFALRGRLGGTPTKPDFDVMVLINDVSLRPRALQRLVRVKTAQITLNPKEARIENFSATIDDQGVITIGTAGTEPGRLVFERLLPQPEIKYLRLPVRGERLSYRSPGVFALDDLGLTLEVEGNLKEQLTLRGDVRVVTGRFTQDVAIRDMAISTRLGGESYKREEPSPLIDNMRLDLRVRTVGDTFLIQNNLAPEMYAMVDLRVGGTASEPQLDGSILPTDGRFKMPGTGGLRGYFDLTPNANSIVFVGTKVLGESTPELQLEAESVVPDVDGIEHNVRMRIQGPINQAEISFSTTNTGLNQNETLLLLLSGRPTTGGVRFGTTSSNIGQNFDTGFRMAGNVTRDLVDNLLQPYISDTLSLLTGDRLQLRPTLGPDGVEVRVFGRAGRYLRLQLSYLQGFQGRREARSEGRLWIADFFLFRTFADFLEWPQQGQGFTESTKSLNVELFVEWPIRFDLP